MLLCDDARARRDNPNKVDVYGLAGAIRFAPSQSPPFRHSLCVYAVLTEGRGAGQGRIALINADTAEETYTGHPFEIQFDANPLKPKGLIVRIPSCSFPEMGLYWVELRYNDHVIAQEPLVVEQLP
jgi:hypothetical protein